jgi:hypothetical protein
MLFHPTAVVDVLRGTSTNSYGDPVDTDTAVAQGLPAHITEVRKGTTTPAGGAPRVVRGYTCRLPGGADVQAGDRIRVPATGAVYAVDAVTRPAGGALVPDLRVDLRRVS